VQSLPGENSWAAPAAFTSRRRTVLLSPSFRSLRRSGQNESDLEKAFALPLATLAFREKESHSRGKWRHIRLISRRPLNYLRNIQVNSRCCEGGGPMQKQLIGKSRHVARNSGLASNIQTATGKMPSSLHGANDPQGAISPRWRLGIFWENMSIAPVILRLGRYGRRAGWAVFQRAVRFRRKIAQHFAANVGFRFFYFSFISFMAFDTCTLFARFRCTANLTKNGLQAAGGLGRPLIRGPPQ